MAPTVLQETACVYVKLHVLNSQFFFPFEDTGLIFEPEGYANPNPSAYNDAECVCVALNFLRACGFQFGFSKTSALYFFFNSIIII